MEVDRRLLIDKDHKDLSIRRQCQLLGITRSSLYYEAKPVSDEMQNLMDMIDQGYTAYPFYGTRRMIAHLKREHNITVGRKMIRRAYQLLGLQAVYPKPKLSRANKAHKLYPYLLSGVEIKRVNHVWSTDLTYIKLRKGFIYLVAIIDWHSRYVLDWDISVTLEADFCVDTLERCLLTKRCEIFNTDQGSQFTSKEFTSLLLANDIKISMDGKGRALDNVFVERLWRSVKYECVYLYEFENVAEAIAKLKDYFWFYNNKRPHQSLDYKTPADIYFMKS